MRPDNTAKLRDDLFGTSCLAYADKLRERDMAGKLTVRDTSEFTPAEQSDSKAARAYSGIYEVLGSSNPEKGINASKIVQDLNAFFEKYGNAPENRKPDMPEDLKKRTWLLRETLDAAVDLLHNRVHSLGFQEDWKFFNSHHDELIDIHNELNFGFTNLNKRHGWLLQHRYLAYVLGDAKESWKEEQQLYKDKLNEAVEDATSSANSAPAPEKSGTFDALSLPGAQYSGSPAKREPVDVKKEPSSAPAAKPSINTEKKSTEPELKREIDRPARPDSEPRRLRTTTTPDLAASLMFEPRHTEKVLSPVKPKTRLSPEPGAATNNTSGATARDARTKTATSEEHARHIPGNNRAIREAIHAIHAIHDEAKQLTFQSSGTSIYRMPNGTPTNQEQFGWRNVVFTGMSNDKSLTIELDHRTKKLTIRFSQKKARRLGWGKKGNSTSVEQIIDLKDIFPDNVDAGPPPASSSAHLRPTSRASLRPARQTTTTKRSVASQNLKAELVKYTRAIVKAFHSEKPARDIMEAITRPIETS